MNKKRILINVMPVDNGYTIQATVSDVTGQRARQVSLIAKDDAEVSASLVKFLDEAFAPELLQDGAQ